MISLLSKIGKFPPWWERVPTGEGKSCERLPDGACLHPAGGYPTALVWLFSRSRPSGILLAHLRKFRSAVSHWLLVIQFNSNTLNTQITELLLNRYKPADLRHHYFFWNVAWSQIWFVLFILNTYTMWHSYISRYMRHIPSVIRITFVSNI